jgi:hypothetical protein
MTSLVREVRTLMQAFLERRLWGLSERERHPTPPTQAESSPAALNQKLDALEAKLSMRVLDAEAFQPERHHRRRDDG